MLTGKGSPIQILRSALGGRNRSREASRGSRPCKGIDGDEGFEQVSRGVRDAALVDGEHEVPLTTFLDRMADRYDGLMLPSPQVSAQLSGRVLEGRLRGGKTSDMGHSGVPKLIRSGSVDRRVAATLPNKGANFPLHGKC